MTYEGDADMRIWLRFMVVTALILAAAACGSGTKGSYDGGEDFSGDYVPDTSGLPCTVEGDTRCLGFVFQECVRGYWEDLNDCAEDGMQCADELGCVVCVPRRTYCEGNLLMQCNDDGTAGTLIADCEALEGSACDPATGSCVNLCDQAASNRSNVGCLYWAVDLDNSENSIDDAAGEQFAVAIANVHNRYTATVTVTTNEAGYGNPLAPNTVATVEVHPGLIAVIDLPRRDVDGPNITEHTDDGPQSCLSSLAFKIENGAIVGRVKDVSIAGNIYELLQDGSAVSQETQWIYSNFRLPYILLPDMNVVAKEYGTLARCLHRSRRFL